MVAVLLKAGLLTLDDLPSAPTELCIALRDSVTSPATNPL